MIRAYVKLFSYILLTGLLMAVFGQGCGVASHYSKTDQSSLAAEGSLDFLQARAVLDKNCVACHDGSQTNGSFKLRTEQDFVMAGLVIAGQPQNSKLIKRIRKDLDDPTDEKLMPPKGFLDHTDRLVLENWITNIGKDRTNPFACDPALTLASRLSVEGAKLLTLRQYMNTLEDVLKRLIGTEATTMMSAVRTTVDFPSASSDRYARGSSNLSPELTASFFKMADGISTRLIAGEKILNVSKAIMNISPSNCNVTSFTTVASLSNIPELCKKQMVRNLGGLFYRRPLSESPINEVDQHYREFTTSPVYADALANLLVRLMMSQNFLFHIEDQGVDHPDYVKVFKLSSRLIANRLSYAYWNSMPDANLETMAKTMDLNDDAAFMEALNYVINSRRVDESLREFAYGWLNLEKTPEFDPTDSGIKLFSNGVIFDAKMRTAMNQELQEFVSFTSLSGGKLEDLFTSDVATARDPELMKIYGMSSAPPPFETMTKENAVRLGSLRSGILSRAGFLAESSAKQNLIHRSIRIKRDLLCRTTPPPPADTTPPVPMTDAQIETFTTREKYAYNTSSKLCFSCHETINPYGFALSHYNGLGFYKETEPAFTAKGIPTGAQLKIDPSSDLTAVFGSGIHAANATEYAAIISQRDELKSCFTQNYAEYFLSRKLSPDQDSCQMNYLYKNLARSLPLKDTMSSIAINPEFRLRKID